VARARRRPYDPRVLAYVFWHLPATDAGRYEEQLAAFHAALRADRPGWLGPTTTVGVDALPWLGGAPGYEDWYAVADFAALGTLNEAAVTGARKPPHDAAAASAGPGTAGVMGHVAGARLEAAPDWAAWLDKPSGVAYEDFHAELAAALAPGAGAWMRQMVLGPAPEYCVLADAPFELPWRPRHAWPLRAVVAPG
jgi:hypothetical protein